MAYLALFRGINVGKAKRISMAELTKVVTGLGYGNVKTLLNSGNLVFTAPEKQAAKAGPAIQHAVEKELGVVSRVTVLSAEELNSALTDDPLVKVATDSSKHLIGVVALPADLTPHAALTAQDWFPESLAISGRFVWIWSPAGVLESKSAAALNKVLKDRITMRNRATMEKLRDMCAAIM